MSEVLSDGIHLAVKPPRFPSPFFEECAGVDMAAASNFRMNSTGLVAVNCPRRLESPSRGKGKNLKSALKREKMGQIKMRKR
jgi:hypothetical protein